jgi:DNA adenine methylase
MAASLIPYFASADQFVEPFFGGGGVFFQLPVGYWKTFVINDLDSDVVNFFRCLRDRTDDLIRVCELTPYSREEFVVAFEDAPADLDPIERARRFWVRVRQAFAGIDRKGTGWSRPTSPASLLHGMNSKLESFRMFADALRKCTAVENADAVDVIVEYATPNTFIYCDPPYVMDARNGAAYRHEMDDSHHRRFADACKRAVSKGAMAAISGYSSDLYNAEFAGWRRVEIDVRLVARTNLDDDAATRRTEVIWLSYDESKQIGASRPTKIVAKSSLEKALARQIKR